MFSPNSISKLLGICDKNLKLTGKISTKYIKKVLYKVIGSTLTYTPKACPKCGCVNENFSIIKNWSQNVKVLINRVNNSPTILEIKKQRFYCKHCNSTFIAKTNLTDKRCFISKDVKMSIIDNLTEIMPMKVIAKQHYLSTYTVTRVLKSTELKDK